ncbi:MAG: hypothetical protein ACD_21C00290G0001 [uncultured bacterium]|nr:MAG: hypothetical protein ACD_21C00290G0001 [uncultured bacterium]
MGKGQKLDFVRVNWRFSAYINGAVDTYFMCNGITEDRGVD